MSADENKHSTTVNVAETDDDMMSSSHVNGIGCGTAMSEITEIIEEAQQVKPYPTSETHTHTLFSVDTNNIGLSDHHPHLVYVAVGKGESSMDALLWALTRAAIPPITLVYLVHVFSDLKSFPSPLGGGRVPKSQVTPALAETYLAQDRSKRRELLSKYMDKCTAHLVQVETILIESDSVTNAITELISVLNIPMLVVGISKSNLRKRREGKGKGNGIVADEILQRTPAGCEVKIICQGNDVSELRRQEPSSPITSTPKLISSAAMPPPTTTIATKEGAEDDNKLQHHSSDNISFPCCIKPSF